MSSTSFTTTVSTRTGEEKSTMDKVDMFVEASRDCQQLLWRIIAEPNPDRWVGQSRGYNIGVGTVEGRDVCVSLNFDTIDGMYVCFYSCEGMFCHWGVVEDYLKTHYPVFGQYNGKKNATEFMFCCIIK